MPATPAGEAPSRVSGSVAMRCSTPNSRAIGAVTKLLVAVMMAQSSPSRGAGAPARALRRPIIGRMLAFMNSRASASSSPRRMARERARAEVEELVDVERAGLVLLVELAVLRLVDVAVEHALLDQELRPLVVAVAGEQGVVEVEENEIHGALELHAMRGQSRFPRRPLVLPESASIRR